MSTIAVGSTLNVQFQFIYDNTLFNPDTLTGEIFKDNISQGAFSPTYATLGIYVYQWVPTEVGSFELRYTGEFNDSKPDIVHRKYFLIGGLDPSATIDSSYVITMLGTISPLYVDPEYILQYYPSGDLTEITEIIHRKSLELEFKIKCTNIAAITALQHEFIVAATMCELSRIYGLSNSGFNGFSSANNFKLGDLEVDHGANAARLGTGKYDYGNAGSWCEMAASLKAQLSSGEFTFRPVVAGSAFDNPIITRELKTSDF